MELRKSSDFRQVLSSKRGVMRREKRPFVVEVKRGQKRSGASLEAELKPESDKKKAAEAALFGSDASAGALSAAPSTSRRILEAIEPEQPEVVIELPRRGRKLGSKNKPREAVDAKAPKIGRAHV